MLNKIFKLLGVFSCNKLCEKVAVDFVLIYSLKFYILKYLFQSLLLFRHIFNEIVYHALQIYRNSIETSIRFEGSRINKKLNQLFHQRQLFIEVNYINFISYHSLLETYSFYKLVFLFFSGIKRGVFVD